LYLKKRSNSLKLFLFYSSLFYILGPSIALSQEYPKLEAHGELRTRLVHSRETMDLGANPQPYFTDVFDPNLGASVLTLVEPKGTTSTDDYLAIGDNYVDFRERFLGTLEMSFNRDTLAAVTMKNTNSNFGGYKPPREMTLMPLRDENAATNIEEAYLKVLNLCVEGLTLKAGRQLLDFELGFFFNDIQKEGSLDMVQISYMSNPWQVTMFYIHPTLDKMRSHGGTGNENDNEGAFLRYKGDTWRYTSAFVSGSDYSNFLGPISLFNQIGWDPLPSLETEAGVAYSLGKIPNEEDQRFSAGAMDINFKYKTQLPFAPQLGCEFIMAQGGKTSDKKNFSDLATSKDYGFIVESDLTNQFMINPFLSLHVTKNSDLTIKHYYFSQYRSHRQFISKSFNEGGIAIPTNGQNKDIGHEFDLIHDAHLLDNLTSQIYAAWFLPGHAYGNNPDSPFPGTGWNKIAFQFRWQILYTF